ncbi:MAG: hypothetical protein LBD45_05660, partial [Bacteroidales bacterium]|nr:hypothetical protein [Bacteroidales bacterium]
MKKNNFFQFCFLLTFSIVVSCNKLKADDSSIVFFEDTYNFKNYGGDDGAGRCTGFAMTAVLFKVGKISPSYFQTNAQTVYELQKENVTDFIQHCQDNAHIGAFQNYLNAEWRHLNLMNTNKKIVEKVKNTPEPIAIAYNHAVVAYSYSQKTDGSHVIYIYDNNVINKPYSLVYSADYATVYATEFTMLFDSTGPLSGWAVTADEISNLLPNYKIYDKGVVINGVNWSTRNVGENGEFVSSPEKCGIDYTWDAAQHVCPVDWSLPTREDIMSLLDSENVTSEWTIQNGVNGYLFTDKTTGATLFLPAAGGRDGNTGSLNNRGLAGYYWSSTPFSSDQAYYLQFFSYDTSCSHFYYTNGFSVHPVHKRSIIINGVNWSTRNVGENGEFVSSREKYGVDYTWEDAQHACPAGWSLPTREDIMSLLDSENVTNEWTIQNGINGYLFTDKTTGATLFLPAAGGRDGNTGSLNNRGLAG